MPGVNFPLLQVGVQLYSAGSRFSFTTSACPPNQARTHAHTHRGHVAEKSAYSPESAFPGALLHARPLKWAKSNWRPLWAWCQTPICLALLYFEFNHTRSPGTRVWRKFCSIFRYSLSLWCFADSSGFDLGNQLKWFKREFTCEALISNELIHLPLLFNFSTFWFTSAFSSSSLFALAALIFLFIKPQRFLTGFRSGEFPGQSSTAITLSFNQVSALLVLLANQ